MCSSRLLGGSHNTLYGAAIQSAPRWRTVRGATGYTLSVRENGAMVSFKCAREAPGLPGAVCWEPGCHAGRVQRPSGDIPLRNPAETLCGWGASKAGRSCPSLSRKDEDIWMVKKKERACSELGCPPSHFDSPGGSSFTALACWHWLQLEPLSS